MNKILLPEYPGNNLLFHCVSHGNAVDALNLLESKNKIIQTNKHKLMQETLMDAHLFIWLL